MSKLPAIIVAAGFSHRMGFDKLAAPLAGKSVLARTLETFLACDAITEIILVAPPERMALLEEITLTKPLRRVDGGMQRHLSVANGLAAASSDAELIAIHDAARPLVSQTDILSTLEAAREHEAASLARRVTETLKRSDDSDFTLSSITRENLWFMETPQIFQADLIRRAYAHILGKKILVTDEASAIESLGKTVKLVPSTSPNPKITIPADLETLNLKWP